MDTHPACPQCGPASELRIDIADLRHALRHAYEDKAKLRKLLNSASVSRSGKDVRRSASWEMDESGGFYRGFGLGA